MWFGASERFKGNQGCPSGGVKSLYGIIDITRTRIFEITFCLLNSKSPKEVQIGFKPLW